MNAWIHHVLGKVGVEAHLVRNLKAVRDEQKRMQEVQKWQFLTRIQPATILDVGANEGQFARLARAVCQSAVIHSFEPLPNVYQQLVQNLQQLQPAHAHCFALGQTNETAVIEVNDFTPSSSMLPVGKLHVDELPHTARTRPVSIQVRRLDDAFAAGELPEPIFIKIDVQGFEDRVLAGGPRTLQSAAAVVMEMSSYGLYEGQAEFDGLYAQMKSLGFVFRGVVDQWIASDGRILQFDGLFERVMK